MNVINILYKAISDRKNTIYNRERFLNVLGNNSSFERRKNKPN